MEAFKTRRLSSLFSGQRRETTIWTLGVAIVLSMLLGDYIHRVAGIEDTVLLAANGSVFFILLIYLDRKYRLEKISPWKSIPVSAIPIFIAYFSFWNEKSFGGFDFGAILFHYQAGFGSFVEPVIQKRAIRYAIFSFVLVVSIYYFNLRIRNFRLFDIALAVVVFYFTPISGVAWGFIKYSIEKTPLSADYRHIGVGDLTTHGANKNLIIIYAESAERTFQELDAGPDIFRDLIQVASRGIEVKGIRQVANTGWSVAGLVASQCGIPLQQHKSFYRNLFAGGDKFLGNAQCLGDLLKNHFYKLVYISGADLSFAGMDKFLYQHGYNDVYDIRDTEYKFKEYPNSWGLYDDSLFEIAVKNLKLFPLVRSHLFCR